MRLLIRSSASAETVLSSLTVTGSIVETHRDLEEVFDLHARGKTEIERSECALDDVNEAIEAVLDGTVGTWLAQVLRIG